MWSSLVPFTEFSQYYAVDAHMTDRDENECHPYYMNNFLPCTFVEKDRLSTLTVVYSNLVCIENPFLKSCNAVWMEHTDISSLQATLFRAVIFLYVFSCSHSKACLSFLNVDTLSIEQKGLNIYQCYFDSSSLHPWILYVESKSTSLAVPALSLCFRR